MTKNPKISVVIPVFNGESRYLDFLLNNLKNQSLKDIEIICVNDGSTDNTKNFLEKAKDKDSRIKVINKENEGTAFARKVGLDISQGEYILFADQDDWYENNALEILYENAKNNNSDLVFFDVYWYNQSKNTKTTHPWNDLSLCFDEDTDFDNLSFNYKDIRPHVLRRHFAPWYKMYRREFLEKYDDLCFPKNVIYHDVALHLQVILRAERISFIPKQLYTYRVGQKDQTTAKLSVSKSHVFEGYTISLEVWSILKKENKLEEFLLDAIDLILRTFKYRFDIADENFKEEFYEKIKERLLEMKIEKSIDLIENEEYKTFYKQITQSQNFKEYLLFEEINSLNKNIEELKKELREFKTSNEKLKKEKERYKKNNKMLKKEIDLTKHSNSWKLTKPLRKFSKLIKK